LSLIMLAKSSGMTSLAGRAELVRMRADWLNEVLPKPRETFPFAATYSNVVRAVDAQQVRQVMNDLLTRVGAMKRCGDHASREDKQAQREKHVHVALDGKTLRGTLGHAAADQQK